jgi:arylsulfatase A-like enzyme
VCSDSPSDAERSASPLGRYGLNHRGRNVGSGQQFGKCHEVPVWQTSPIGPFNAWPSGGGGFETFYGFIGGENNQFEPALYDGFTPVEPPATAEDGYHLTEDLADRCVGWIRQQKALAPERPFMAYFAPGATHAPHHCPEEWIEKYKGKFDDGWDALRDEAGPESADGGVPLDSSSRPIITSVASSARSTVSGSLTTR